MDRQKIVFALLAVPVLGSLWMMSRSSDRTKQLRSEMLSQLAQPAFSGNDFLRQLTGVDGKFEMYRIDDQEIYISIPRTSFDANETITKLAERPEEVELAKDFKDRQRVGRYDFYNESRIFFKMPASDLRVDADSVLETKFPDGTYKVTVGELTDFYEKELTFSGPKAYQFRDAPGGKLYKFINHGAFVSKHEPSLRRFARQLAKSSNNEATVSALLSFVADDIPYDHLNAMSRVSLIKHADETLFTKIGTCSGKTILYASLLQQMGVPYLLAYVSHPSEGLDHIGVLVPAGSFPNKNGYKMTVFGKEYQYAETTAKGFKIGETKLKNTVPARDIVYVQVPGSPVVDVKTGKPLEAAEDADSLFY